MAAKRLRAGIGLLTALLIGIWALAPAGASAESVCTDTWTGPAEGNWGTATDWSTGKVPTSTAVACIGSGKTVDVTEGANQTGVVQGAGTLAISGGSLEVANAWEASSLATLSIMGGILKGAAEVDVTSSFTGGGDGAMVGTASTVIESGAVGTITANKAISFDLYERTLKNAGTLTVGKESGLQGEQKARLINSGTLIVNGETPNENHGLSASGEIILTNTGTLKKTEGTGVTFIQMAVANEGTVSATSGKLEFSASSTSSEHAVWSVSGTGAGFVFDGSGATFALGGAVSMSGASSMEITSGTVTTSKIEGSTASGVVISAHTRMEVNGTSPSTLGAVDK